MNDQIHSLEWFRDKFKKKELAKHVMTAAEYQAKIKPVQQKKSSIKDYMARELKDSNLPFVREHKFCETRKFRFDWAIITTHCKIAIEYEGIISKKSRHTGIVGFSKDTEKYNLAQSLGWVVLRYTALNYKNMMRDVLEIIENSVKK